MVSTKIIGPWAGGLNLINNRDRSIFLNDKELGEALNVVYTTEGFVEPRPGYKRFLYDFGTYDSIRVIGSLELPDGTSVVFVQTVVGTGPTRQAKVYTIKDKNTVALVYTPPADTVFNHVMSYKSINSNHTGVFLFADLSGKSARNPALDLSGAWAPINASYAVPASNQGFIVKDRLFLFDYDNSRMWWSPANYILDFNRVDAINYGSDSFSEEPIEVTFTNDGIKSVSFLNNNFYIFKKTKTYMFTYQSDPFTDGYLRKISENTGAYDSCVVRNNVVIVNNRGVFRVDGTQFEDLQKSLDLRFEIPIDHANIKTGDIFITVFNDQVLVGLRDYVNNPTNPTLYYYVMNVWNGAWSRWDFNYIATPMIARPGDKHFKAQGTGTSSNIMLTSSFSRQYLAYTDYKPGSTVPEYHMDSNNNSFTTYDKLYIPPVVIKTNASFGNSQLVFTKLYRTFIRFYMSDLPKELLPSPAWKLSINYNAYQFEYDTTLEGNPIFTLHPSNQKFADINLMPGTGSLADNKYAIYTRTYQVPIPQQRIKEFVIELSRAYSEVDWSYVKPPGGLINPDADRPIKHGYYFLLSHFYVDYQDKAGI